MVPSKIHVQHPQTIKNPTPLTKTLTKMRHFPAMALINSTHRENEPIGARLLEIEASPDMGLQVGDCGDAWVQEKPAPLQALRSLRLAQHLAIIEDNSNPNGLFHGDRSEERGEMQRLWGREL